MFFALCANANYDVTIFEVDRIVWYAKNGLCQEQNKTFPWKKPLINCAWKRKTVNNTIYLLIVTISLL